MGRGVGLYPLVFEAELKEKIWGGRRLGEALGKELPPGETPIGESWEARGGSVVANGPLGGRTLDDLKAEMGAALVGERVAGMEGEVFPLLFKYIDASEWLSVQVHPDDGYARERLGQPYGKTEAWYIVSAEPGAQLVHGWKEPTTAGAVGEAVRENRLEGLLEYVPVTAGDVVFVPAGTVHAIGGGIVLGEIQQSSDTTYRLYDWGRVGFDGKPRELHLEESLRTLYYGLTTPHKTSPVEVRDGDVTRRFLTACRHFALESVEGGVPWELGGDGGSFQFVSPLDGAVRLSWPGGELELGRGRTALVPAGLGGCRVSAGGGYRLLRMWAPDLLSEVVAALRAAGCGAKEITGLGGDLEHNDLAPLVG